MAYSPGLPSQDDIPDPDNIQVDDDPLHVEFQEDIDSEEILPELFSDDSDSDSEFDEDSSADFDDSDSETEETNIIDDNNQVWEPPLEPLDPSVPNLPQAQPQADALASEHLTAGRQNVENQLRQPITVKTYTDHYPDSGAGAPDSDILEPNAFADYSAQITNSDTNPYAPFENKLNWDIARWAKLRGPGSTALNELLKIQDVSIVLIFYNI